MTHIMGPNVWLIRMRERTACKQFTHMVKSVFL